MNLDFPTLSQKNIHGLDISMNDISRVEVLHSLAEISGKKSNIFFRKMLLPLLLLFDHLTHKRMLCQIYLMERPK